MQPTNAAMKSQALRLVAIHGSLFSQHLEYWKSDKDVILAAVQTCGFALAETTAELTADKTIVLAAVKTDGRALMHAAACLADDEDVVRTAVLSDGSAIQFASKRLMIKRSLVLAAVQNDKTMEAMRSTRAYFADDREIMLAAVRKNCFSLKYASKELRGDKEIVLAAVEKNGVLLKYTNVWNADSIFVFRMCHALSKQGLNLQHGMKYVYMLSKFDSELALSFFRNGVTVKDLMERETYRHKAMVHSLALLSKVSTDETVQTDIDEFVAGLSAPSSLIAKHDCRLFERDEIG
jgi:hypothetical protein